jgi:glycosyltransferase involved in cell wall biosynthesis
LLILDTPQFIEWFARQYHTSPKHFRTVLIGADDRFFYPMPEIQESEPLTVIYYGGYIPNHGVETIIEAARLLQSEAGLRFEMIGEGPTRPETEALVHKYNLQNITFIDWLERDLLAKHIARAGIVLGAFSLSEQLSLTNNNKVYEAFAMRKAVITARTPALPELVERSEALLLVERADPQQLAQAILMLTNNPDLRTRLGGNGRKLFEEHFNPTVIGESFARHLHELLQVG